jgi:hypothetical protein
MYPILEYSRKYAILEYYAYLHTYTLYVYPVFVLPIYMYRLLTRRRHTKTRRTKFEVNQTNLERVILPSGKPLSSDDLRPDVS